MILECPNCNARLNAAAMPTPGKPVRCSKCKEVFYPGSPNTPPQNNSASGEESDWSSVAASPQEEPEEREEPQRRSRKAPKPTSKFPVLLVVSGVFAFLVVVGAVVAVAFMGGDKSSSGNSNAANQTTTPPKKDNPAKKDGPKTDSTSTSKLQIPPEYAEVFRESAEKAAPITLVPTLKKIGMEEFRVPSFASKTEPDPEAGKLTLDELKKATTFIKVMAGNGGGGTGSGFVIRSDRMGILIATNFHVVGSKTGGRLMPDSKIAVVFDSGLPTQRSLKAEVVAMDSEIDLAVVKVAAFDPLPKAIDASLSPKLVETMNIRSFGFPLGASLGVDGLNPNVTVGSGTVSSVRLNATGAVSLVQINGASLNPGNSGGPVVDDNGKLVGIVVSGIPGSGIANAIPATKLADMLTGRAYPPTISTASEEEGQASFHIDVPLSDPLRKIKDVILHVWSGEVPPPIQRESTVAWKVVAGAEATPLKLELRSATGKFKLALPSTDNKTIVLLQLECTNESGEKAVSPPVRYLLAQDGVQTAGDAIPLATFRQDLSKYHGQVVAVRGKLSPGTIQRSAVYEVQVADDSNMYPTGLVFLADREVATQLNELPLEAALDVRLTLRVGKQGANATTPARVARIDFIGRGNRLAKTIPSSEEPVDPLIALNRKPEKFVGQTIVFLGLLSPVNLGSEQAPELSIAMISGKRPENLHFTSPNRIVSQLKGPGYSNDGLYPAQITVQVEPRVLNGTGSQIATVTKIEFVDKEGKPGKTLE
jgi:predicted Zn finger-like uncharacterized protein